LKKPFEAPELVEVRAASVDKRRVSEFNMNLSLKRVASGKDDAKGAKGAKRPAKDAGKKG